MPLFNGSNLFGVSVEATVAENPRAAQSNAYPGLDGLEELDQGIRGRIVTVSGRLLGSTPSNLGAAEALIRSYNDGLAYIYVDQFGGVWPNTKLESFEPQGRVNISPDLNGNGPVYHRRYVARFRVLT